MEQDQQSRIGNAWFEFKSLRAQKEPFGAVRELSVVQQLVSDLPKRISEKWRDMVSQVQLEPPEIQQIDTAATKRLNKALALLDHADSLLDEELLLILTNVMELEAVGRFLESRAIAVPFITKMPDVRAALSSAKQSKKVGRRILNLESLIARNARG